MKGSSKNVGFRTPPARRLAVFAAVLLLLPLSAAIPAFAADEEASAEEACVGLSGKPDADCDGAPDDAEGRRGTDPNACDSDGDGLSDGVEMGYIQPKLLKACHGLQPAGTNFARPGTLDPLDADSDGDGLKDGEEDRDGGDAAGGNGWLDPDESDPTLADTDGDGVSDYIEATGDFDGDGLPDFDRRLVNSGPKCDPPAEISDLDCDEVPNARDLDSDGDACPDAQEGGWLDANGDAVPDIYDAHAKACPEERAPGGTLSFGAKPPPESNDGEGTSAAVDRAVPLLPDGSDGAACELVGGRGAARARDWASVAAIALAAAIIAMARRLQLS